MPKEKTHWILAEQAFAGLPPSPLKTILWTHHDLYLSGAVLPDTLMHLFHGPQARTALALSKRFHDTGGNSYAPFIEAEARCADGIPPRLMACLLGMIAHMQADIVFHPFIYAVGGTEDIGRHYRLETALDGYSQRRIAPAPARYLKDLLDAAARDDLTTASAMIFDPGGELPRESHEQALDLHCRFQGFYDRTHWQLAVRLLGLLHVPLVKNYQHLFYPLHPGSDDVLLAGTVPWQHPVTGELRTDSIEVLAGHAVQCTIDILTRIAEAGSLAPALTEPPGENLLTGMYGVRAEAMTAAPKLQGAAR